MFLCFRYIRVYCPVGMAVSPMRSKDPMNYGTGRTLFFKGFKKDSNMKIYYPVRKNTDNV